MESLRLPKSISRFKSDWTWISPAEEESKSRNSPKRATIGIGCIKGWKKYFKQARFLPAIGVGRVSEAGAGEVGVCEATAATPCSLLLEPLGFFIGTKNLCIAFTRKYYDFFNALYRLRDCQRLLLRDCHRSRPLRECKPRRCFQPIKILQFYWCYFMIGRGILQPLLELLNTEPASDCF